MASESHSAEQRGSCIHGHDPKYWHQYGCGRWRCLECQREQKNRRRERDPAAFHANFCALKYGAAHCTCGYS